MKKNIIIFVVLILLFPILGKTQIQVDVNTTPDEIVALLVGDGVSYSNVTYTGDLAQFGSFDENGSGFGLANGVILGTGDVTMAEGPNDSGSESLMVDNASFGDQDLEDVAGVEMNDVAILEFDFVPMGSDITFHYVFGSEEYNEYVCGDYNDAFGFFLSGPGINGGFSSPSGFPNGSVNIALIPGGNIGVSIGTVNNGSVGEFGFEENCANLDPNWESNTEYFIDNDNGLYVQYDGYTVVMEAYHEVQCGETYHIKIAIGDGYDSSFDSGVFLEENSFSSAVPSTAELNILQDTPIENGVFENCGGAILEFIRNENDLSDELTVDLIYSGDAENGIDYDLPTSITFPAGESMLQLDFDPFADPFTEPLENVLISMSFVDGCLAEQNIDLIELIIVDVQPLGLTTNDVAICGDEQVELIPEVTGGISPYSYDWSNGATTESIFVDGNGSLVYTVTVNDICENTAPVSGDFNLSVGEPPVITYPPGSLDIICQDEIEVDCVIEGAFEQIVYTTEQGDTIGNTNPTTYSAAIGATSLTATVVGDCGETAQVIIPINYIDPPELTLDIGGDVTTNCTIEVNLSPTVTGGSQPYNYSWQIDGVEVGNDSVYSFITPTSVSVLLEVVGQCGGQSVDSLQVIVPESPIMLTTSADVLVCPHTQVSLTAQATGGVGDLTYTWTGNLGTEQQVHVLAEESEQYTVVVADLCGATASEVINIEVIPFEVQYGLVDIIDDEYYFEAYTYPPCENGCSYYWDFGDNSSSTDENTSHQYDRLDTYNGLLIATNEQGCVDSTHFTVYPQLLLYVPNSFTPNHDGINDVFRVYGIGVLDFDLKIYNRWGALVYHSKNIDDVWLGEGSEKLYYTQNECYNYVITAKGYDLTVQTKTGVLTVIR